MLKRIDAVVLFVNDLETSKAFYRDKLGLKVRMEADGFAELEFENTTIGLLSIPAAQGLLSKDLVSTGRRQNASGQFAAFVDDVHSVCSQLKERGVRFIKDPADQPWGQRTANFQDPDGNIWEISQWLKK
jgi:catechol 2,3-dioxygenase-like lactoylglutathione lyase family enzyme